MAHSGSGVNTAYHLPLYPRERIGLQQFFRTFARVAGQEMLSSVSRLVGCGNRYTVTATDAALRALARSLAAYRRECIERRIACRRSADTGIGTLDR